MYKRRYRLSFKAIVTDIENAVFIILAVLFLAGLFYGAICEKSGFATYYISAVIRIYKSSSYFELSCYLFLSQLMLSAAVMFACVSCIGAPIIALVPFCSGYVNGCQFAYFMQINGIKGAAGYFLILWLPVFLQCLSLLYLSSCSLVTSVKLFKLHFLGTAHSEKIKIRMCLYIFFAVCIAAFIFSMFEGLLIKLFIPVFL